MKGSPGGNIVIADFFFTELHPGTVPPLEREKLGYITPDPQLPGVQPPGLHPGRGRAGPG